MRTVAVVAAFLLFGNNPVLLTALLPRAIPRSPIRDSRVFCRTIVCHANNPRQGDHGERRSADDPLERTKGRVALDKEDEDDEIDNVSDAEALLACQAYLVRKKRLNWTAAEERQRRREEVMVDAYEDRQLGLKATGFFWEDLSQLRYLYRNESDMFETTAGSSRNKETTTPVSNITVFDDWVLVDDAGTVLSVDDEETSITSPDTVRRLRLRVDDEEEDEEIFDDFTAIDGTPSPSHIRRSNAAKLRWSDPIWKAQWYARRWGDRSGNNKKKRKSAYSRRLEGRIRSIDPDSLLASPEMVALTEDEIAEAIRVYVKSNRKRVLSRTRTLEKRKSDIEWDPSSINKGSGEVLDRESLLRRDPAALEEAQRRRSESAKQAYQKRLENKATKEESIKLVPSSHSEAAATPTEALLRIQSDLDASRMPAIADVELMLEPSKLSSRKDVLRRILSTCFDLRGKCIPADFMESGKINVSSKRMVFVTHCAIDLIGAFVLVKLKETEPTKTSAGKASPEEDEPITSGNI
jgi:hypothetical protein